MKNIEQKIKIMVITPYFPPYTGGVQNYVYSIAIGLQKMFNWEVIVVTSKTKIKNIQTEQRDGLKIYHLPVLFNFSNTPINPAWYSQIKQIIKKENPILINAHAPVPFMADMAALASGETPFIVTYHTGSMKKGKILTDLPILAYEKILLPYLLNKSKLIISSSDFIKKTFLQSYVKKVTTVNPGVDHAKIKQMKKKTTYAILFVGGLTKAENYKGVDYLLRAVALLKISLPEVKLVIVGKGDGVDGYKAIAKTYGITEHVTFKGSLQGEALHKMYQDADVLALPSASESFGTVLIEAMAQSTPVVTTTIGGIPDVVTNGKEGLLVPAKDEKALATALLKILENKNLATEMGRAGYEKVKNHYLWSLQVEKTKNIMTRQMAK